jgi:hypothetical protein
MLEVTFAYENVLYQIDNESHLPYEVSDYWATFIHAAAGDHEVYVTDSRLFSAPGFDTVQDFSNPEVHHPITTTDLYGFLDTSQSNGTFGQLQYDNLFWYRLQVLDHGQRPINNVKIYRFAWPPFTPFRDRYELPVEEGALKLWRCLFAGMASCRYHRWNTLGAGLGLSTDGQVHIRAASMLVDAIDIFSMEPDNSVLSGRTEDEAYALVNPGQQWAIVFTGDGDREAAIDLTPAAGDLEERWLDIYAGEWRPSSTVSSSANHQLFLPPAAGGPWAVVLTAQ